MELNKINEFKWEIPKTAGMKVPAYIYASEKLLSKIKEDRTLEQLKNMAWMPGIYKKAIALPDAHQGYGFCIGGVAALSIEDGGLSPGGVGYDINCGVRLLKTNLTEEEVRKKIVQLVDSIFKNVPSGLGSEGKIKLSKEELKNILENGARWAVEQGYGNEQDLMHQEANGCLSNNDYSLVSDRALKRGIPQLGSLGAGNHFLEINKVDKIFDEKTAKVFGIENLNQVCVMIHCGSRGLGHQVCSDYLRTMEDKYRDLVKKLPDRELVYAPAGSKLCDDYLKAMNCAANYAWANRQLIMHWVRESFEKVFNKKAEDMDMKLIYDVCHNIAKVEEYDGKKFYVHRKGATRCFPAGHKEIPSDYKEVGQPVLIPGTMGTASYVLVGTETAMSETFGSTAHGAGRVSSRYKATKAHTGSEIISQLGQKGIVIKAASMKVLAEEAPDAYKDIDEVARVSDSAGIAKVVARLTPIGVIKG